MAQRHFNDLLLMQTVNPALEYEWWWRMFMGWRKRVKKSKKVAAKTLLTAIYVLILTGIYLSFMIFILCFARFSFLHDTDTNALIMLRVYIPSFVILLLLLCWNWKQKFPQLTNEYIFFVAFKCKNRLKQSKIWCRTGLLIIMLIMMI